MEHLIKNIESFNTHFAYIDDNDRYTAMSRLQATIKTAITELSHTELIELKAAISESKAAHFKLDDLIEASKPVVKSEMSKLMSNAWAMLKAGLFTTLSDALKAAWRKAKLVQQLKNGIARFSFLKADNTVRNAIGTLKNGNFTYKTKSTGKANNAAVIKYFDMEKNSWRSCRIDRLLSVA